MSSAPIEVLIFGAGAVGAFYGSRLAQAPNVKVSCVCRSNYKAVASNGFAVSSPQYGDYKWMPTRVFANPKEAEQSGVKWEYIVVSTKALPDVSDDSESLEGLVHEGTAVVLIQNGLGVEEPYAKRFSSACILSAVTVVSAAQERHGEIKHNRWTRINIGPYLPNPSATSTHAEQQNAKFAKLLQQGGVKDAEAYTHAKLQLVRWHKLAINASMNPSSVLSNGSTNAAMAKDPELSRHLHATMLEILHTAPKIIGQEFPPEFASADKLLASTRKNTSGSRPSMWLDWEAGKRMELEVILGNPIRIAREKGFEMPRLQTLYALLKMAQTNRDEQAAKAKL
ncbi:2-dehydropantoate 2-reductase, partial [Aureobasidium melanogenum]|uniref:2-dehydropantoate 2-reductase n=1 Tax=Aureobasidium melanogenum (strain CBS 110374) TaxID=1043003 RepID=A0A074VUC7_AURM1